MQHRPPSYPNRPDRRRPRHVPAGRRLHQIDIENLLGKAPNTATRDEVHQALERYRAAARPAPGDHVVIASNPAWSCTLAELWPGAAIRCRCGQDGAEKELLDVIDVRTAAERYDAVWVASGDGRFTEFVADVRARGQEVVVVGRKGSIAATLRRAASATVAFGPGRSVRAGVR